MAERSADVIRRYLSDAIAAEKVFEAHLGRLTKATDNESARTVFDQHAHETTQQHERLTDRLNSLGANSPGAKSFLAHVFGFYLKSAQLARTIQSEASGMAQEIWSLLTASALDVYKRVTGSRSVRTTT